MFSRRIAFFFYAALFFAPCWVIAQADTTAAAKWQFSIQQQEGNELLLVATGEIRPGWGVFSLAMPDDMPHTRWVVDTTEGNRLIGGKERNAPLRERSELLSTDIAYHKGTIVLEAVVQTSGKPVKGVLSYMAFRGEEFTNPVEVPFRIVPDAQGKYQLVSAELAASALASQKVKRATIDMDHPVANCGGTGAEGPKSLWRIFMLGVLGGLLGLVMPCTFPMIPMTVSFFTKKSNDQSKGIRNAFLYGFFIFLIYVLISIPFYFLEAGNEDILNNISTNAWLNLLFALIFFLFALSFFGLYEIGLPSSFANKVDARSNLGSVGGIFFMALTLAIVSFSCTGPILGTLLVGALNEEGGALQLTIAMAGFGLALGLPFGLFAMFPRWLARLPRSGSWMNTVKMVFAFIELALMVKFLSNADLVMHWGLLKREVFIGIWIILSLLTSLYLFGIVRFKHDPPPPRLSQGRIMSAILFLLFTVYLLPGVSNTRYANLSLISGFPPPLSYSIYGHGSAKGKGVEATVVNDYEKALQLSRETGKPILLDFTGWACVNCRKMEENVWPDPRIKELIEKNFILVSLYVDDRKALPDDQQFLHTLSDGSTKKIRTVGDLYATMQSENFRNASQPLYAILNADEQLLNLPVGYTPNANAYLQWLECGLSSVKQQ